MALLENSLMIIGAAMCVLALLPLAFWSAQSWTTLKHNRVQFRESQNLLRQQILAANAQRVTDSSAIQSTTPAQVAAQPAMQAQENPAVKSVSRTDAENRVGHEQPAEAKVQPDGTWQGFRKFRVQKLVKETPACTSVYLVPLDNQPIADFKAGQHLPLRFHIPNQSKPVVRCYSLSDGPGKSHYRITVKAIAAGGEGQQPGVVSNFVNHQLKPGDVIESKSPGGSFWIDINDSRPAVLLAGGIGITPMFSMIESVLAHSPDRAVILLYGVRNKAEQAFADDFGRMQKASKNFYAVHSFSNPRPEDVRGADYHLNGYVTIDLIKQLLPNHDCQFYLCGPTPFMESLGTALKSWGVPDNQVHSEAFGPASIGKARPAVSVPHVDGTIEVAFEQAGKTVKWDPTCESLLDLAEQNGVDMDFGCRAGSCGTCATKLIAGDVQYPEDLQVDCEAGECLACVARPVGSVKLGAQS